MFSLLAQREYRIYRFNPLNKFARIRSVSGLGRKADGSVNQDGEVLKFSHWRYGGQFFESGLEVGFNITNSVEEKVKWLEAEKPAYLQAGAGDLEHLALACADNWPVEEITGLHCVGEQLTVGMSRRITSTIKTPIYQNYGLNEIGRVAVKCPAGRYHIHTEHCLVEIVDENNQICPPGTQGRILVTGLQNFAMPLIRYDTGDAAAMFDTPCPCGRTLPSFGDIQGRDQSNYYLPEGTLEEVNLILQCLEQLPQSLTRNLREYQLYQNRDKSYELKTVTKGIIPEEFQQNLQKSVEQKYTYLVLKVIEVDNIPRTAGGKVQYFNSSFFPKS